MLRFDHNQMVCQFREASSFGADHGQDLDLMLLGPSSCLQKVGGIARDAHGHHQMPRLSVVFQMTAVNISVGVSVANGRDPGKVVPRAEILEQLWGYPPRRAADLRVVDVYVARLRGKLEPDPRNPELILTVRGIGYSSQRLGEFPPVSS